VDSYLVIHLKEMDILKIENWFNLISPHNFKME